MDKILQMIGMAKKAGKIVTGGYMCEKAIKNGESSLIVIAIDISDSSRRSMIDLCEHYNVDYIDYADKKQLGKITGGGVHTVVSVNDCGFAEAVLQKYSAQE